MSFFVFVQIVNCNNLIYEYFYAAQSHFHAVVVALIGHRKSNTFGIAAA
jgi:hypothetical protein